MNFLQLFFQGEARKFLSTFTGRLFRAITLYPGIAFLIAGILTWMIGAVMGHNTARTTWTFFFIGAMFFVFRSAYLRGLLFGLLIVAKDLLVSLLTRQPMPDYEEKEKDDPGHEKNSMKPSGTSQGESTRKISFGDRFLAFTDPVRSAFNEFGYGSDSRELKFLKQLEDEWFYISQRSGLSSELRLEEYERRILRYRSKSKFYPGRGFDDDDGADRRLVPSIVVGIERLAFGVRLELELAPGLYFGTESKFRQGKISEETLQASIGELVVSNGLDFEGLKLSKTPNNLNVYVDISFKSLLFELVPMVPPAPGTISAKDDIFIGILETGESVTHNLVDSFHMIMQGGTGSGKSAFTYFLLLQISAMEDVFIAGIDPHTVLFDPAFKGTRHEPLLVTGSEVEDLVQYMELMEDLYVEMNRRLEALNEMRLPEIKQFNREQQLIFIVIDEYPSIYKNLSNRIDTKTAERFKVLISQFLGEARKVGFRVALLMQQANSNILPTEQRGNVSTRISLRVDEEVAIPMLHPQGVTAADMNAFPPGMGFFQAPGVPPQKFRAAYYQKEPDADDLERMSHGLSVDLAYQGYYEGVQRNCRILESRN